MTSWQLRLSRILLPGMRWFQGIYPAENVNALLRWRKWSQGQVEPGAVPTDFQKELYKVGQANVLFYNHKNNEKHKVIYYIHGSGFCFGWNSHFERIAVQLTRQTGRPIYAPDYRIAPEHTYPAAHEDSMAGYQWLLGQGYQPEDIILFGDSSGGHIGLSMLLQLRDQGAQLPAAAILLSAMLDITLTEHYYWHSRDNFVHPRFPPKLNKHYFQNRALDQPEISPLFSDLHGLPPLLIMAGERDILRWDAERFSEYARLAGSENQLVIEPGVWHGWYLFTTYLPEADATLTRIVNFCKQF
ncbi:MAG TPA: alpha/beta hydrolase [Anaerolineae bacterium]|nr:alpha/beta hydrolase [Anaerolineae bacterium]